MQMTTNSAGVNMWVCLSIRVSCHLGTSCRSSQHLWNVHTFSKLTIIQLSVLHILCYCPAGESETFSPKIRRGNRSPRKHGSGHDDFDSATHSPMAAPPGTPSALPRHSLHPYIALLHKLNRRANIFSRSTRSWRDPVSLCVATGHHSLDLP